MQTGIGAGNQPVAQNWGGKLLDIVRRDVRPPLDGGKGLSRAIKRETAARTNAQVQGVLFACGLHQIQKVILQNRVDENIAADGHGSADIFRIDDGLDAGQRIVVAKTVQNLALLLALRIAQRHLNQKAVHLRFRQWESARQLDRVLGRHQEEWVGKLMGNAIYCNVAFFHGFQHGALCAGAGAG